MHDAVVRREVVVVGAGIMGAAAAYALARRGADVLVLEQFRIGHERGSSHGRTRIVRLAYPQTKWVRLAAEGMQGWRALEEETGERLIEPLGMLELVEHAGQSSQAALRAHGAEYELLEAAEVRRRYDGVFVPDGSLALLDPDAGVIHADRAHRALLDAAVRHGARIEEDTRVESLDDVDAETVVVTAGAWVRRLVPDLPVTPTRETVAYFRRDGNRLPAVVELHPQTYGHALYSLYDPDHGLKAGVHHGGAAADPDEDAGPDSELVARAAAWVQRHYADVDPEPVLAETCLYTNTVDERFVLERRGRIVIGSACSGHGFKFAPAVGERLAALALSATS
jgi:sarcosine oxidase